MVGATHIRWWRTEATASAAPPRNDAEWVMAPRPPGAGLRQWPAGGL